MKISVITPSIRPDGLFTVENGLANQTFKDFEWLVCAPDIYRGHAKLPPKFLKDDFEGGFWSLNRAYNKLFKEAKGELIVTLQDWIYVPPDGLQKFVDAHEKYPEAIITGVGDQYERMNKFGKPEVKIWSDPRKNTKFGTFYECYPNDCEWNWAMFPKEFIFEIGGMDEELDFLGYGGDQLQVVERWDFLGRKFYIDQANESYTIRHSRKDFGGQQEWDKNHVVFKGEYEGDKFTSVYDKRKAELVDNFMWPKLNYLP